LPAKALRAPVEPRDEARPGDEITGDARPLQLGSEQLRSPNRHTTTLNQAEMNQRTAEPSRNARLQDDCTSRIGFWQLPGAGTCKEEELQEEQ